MSIHALTGKPGAGKSYHATKRVIEAIESRRFVVTNLPLNRKNEKIAKALDDNLLSIEPTAKQIIGGVEGNHIGMLAGIRAYEGSDYQRADDAGDNVGPLFVIDEAANTWSDLVSKKANLVELQKYLRVHRHHLFDFVLILHSYQDAPAGVGGLIERYHNVINTSEMTGANSYQIVTTNKGYVAGKSGHINKETGRFDKAIFTYYDSYSEGAGAGKKGKKNEKGLFRSRPIWLRWWSILLIGSLLLLPLFVIKTARGIGGIIDSESDIDGFGAVAPPPQTISESALQAALADARLLNPNAVPNALGVLDGLPPETQYFEGYDNNTIYFVSGLHLSVERHLKPKGWSVIHKSPCRVVLQKIDNNGLHFLNYWCVRGY